VRKQVTQVLWLSKDNYTACYCPLNHCRWVLDHCRWHWSIWAYCIFGSWIFRPIHLICLTCYYYLHTPSRYPNDSFTNDMRKPKQGGVFVLLLPPLGTRKKLPAINVLKRDFLRLTGEITCSQQILYQLNVTGDMLPKCNGGCQFHILPTQP
jgi:hypothetical protein